MTFDGNDIEVTRLKIKNEFNWVFADLKSQKNTIKILSDLNKCYPFPSNDLDMHVHQALGEDNQIIVKKAIQILENGTPEELGKIMNEAQKVFDEKISPACKEELEAPVLHKVLEDPKIKELTYGGKGVGSQGDGTIQFIAKNIAMQQQLIDYCDYLVIMSPY